MKDARDKVAIVTGANAGLGFEAAAQLAEAGYGRVILACRSQDKADGARVRLIARTGRDVFDLLAIDVSEVTSAVHAAQTLIDQSGTIDLLVLNAVQASQKLQRTAEGIEVILASSLFGHHVLTMMLLAAGKLSQSAHIVIAGSEGARGESPIPGMDMTLFDYDAIQTGVGGDLTAAMEAVARGEQPVKYDMNRTYGNAKLWIVWWAAAVARLLPKDMTVVAVSPGSAPGTSMSRYMPTFMRVVMLPVFKVIGPFFKMAGTVAEGARRYLDAAELGTDASGKFYASPPGQLVGPMEVQQQPHFYDRRLQDAAWKSLVRLSGLGFPASNSAMPG